MVGFDKFRFSLRQAYPYILIVGGAIGLVASFILSHDTLAISHNSNYVPSCNLNPVLSCGNVINAPGDTILGLPYPFFGIAVFAVLIALGASLLAGARFKRWYWLTFQVLMSLGFIGAYYLLLKSIYKIHSLCPYCLSVDVVTTTLFWYSSLFNIDRGTFKFKAKRTRSVYAWVRAHHLDLLLLWFIIWIGIILKHFWYYYGKHL